MHTRSANKEEEEEEENTAGTCIECASTLYKGRPSLIKMFATDTDTLDDDTPPSLSRDAFESPPPVQILPSAPSADTSPASDWSVLFLSNRPAAAV
jgi:hypothetical protein